MAAAKGRIDTVHWVLLGTRTGQPWLGHPPTGTSATWCDEVADNSRAPSPVTCLGAHARHRESLRRAVGNSLYCKAQETMAPDRGEAAEETQPMTRAL